MHSPSLNGSPGRTRNWFPLYVLVMGLVLTLSTAYFASRTIQVRMEGHFESAALETQAIIHTRLEAYIALLRGGAGLLAVEPDLTRDQFYAYANRLRLKAEYPGIQGIGFTIRIPPSELGRIASRMEQQGLANFHVWPDDPRDEYHAIIYLEPLDARNAAAIGYDMFSEPVRRQAMEHARDNAVPAASGKVTLVQEIEGPKQPGFLVYVPVYEGGGVPDTLAERQEKLVGFVYSPFRAGDLFNSIFEMEGIPEVDVEIFDGVEPHAEGRLYRYSADGERDSLSRPRFETFQLLEVAGRPWTLRLWTRPESDRTWYSVPAVLAGGGLLSLLLFYLTLAQARARRDAEQTAAQLQASEHALRASEERLRLILESAWDYAIFSLDPEGRVTSWNSGAERMFGFKERDILGQSASVIFTPEDRDNGEDVKELELAAKTGVAGNDRWHVRKDGGRFYASGVVRLMRDASGKMIGFIKVARDITERMQAEESLRREKQFSDTIINSLPGVFYLFTHDERYLRWNDEVERVTGYAPDEIRVMRPLDFIVPEDRKFMAARVREVFVKGGAVAEARLQCKDGRVVPYFFTGRRFPVNGVPCVVGMGVDISERKHVEEALREAQAQLQRYATELEQRVAERTANLEQSLQSLEGVLYHVAHDLRAPLRAMASFTNILLDDYGPRFDPRGTDYLHRVSSAAQRMDELVQDLLAYGRLAHMSVPLGKVNLEAEIDGVVQQIAAQIQERGARVEIERPMPTVKANAGVLSLIVLNLLSNALKFVRPESPPHIRIRAEDGGAIRLWIEDNGIGIKPEYQDRIFRIFERLHGGDVYEGTGIGLAIVRKGIERMGGRAGVESVPGEGSRFWLELPAADS
jgi:PAS domain S-box-containing protein